MPNFTPPFGLDPNIVIRNPDNYPKLLLRGIYDVMLREEEANRGSLMERYRKGFNVVVSGLVKARPPRLRVTPNKDIELVGAGFRREAEVSRNEEQKETQEKLRKLFIWLNELRRELPDRQPDEDPTMRSGG